MKQQQLVELILQSLEHEQGGVKVYETAICCAVNTDLKQEFGKEDEHYYPAQRTPRPTHALPVRASRPALS